MNRMEFKTLEKGNKVTVKNDTYGMPIGRRGTVTSIFRGPREVKVMLKSHGKRTYIFTTPGNIDRAYSN